MDRITARALFSIARRQIIHAKHHPQTKHLYSDSYAYALANGVCPYLDIDTGFAEGQELLEADPFTEAYEVPRHTVQQVVELVDQHWRSQTPLTFYGLEDRYCQAWDGRHTRLDLICILRYLYLRDFFDDAFWTRIKSDCPAEAQHIDDDFKIDELDRGL
jgi:hypothetical protein